MRALSYSNKSILYLSIYNGVWKEVFRYIRVISCFVRSNSSQGFCITYKQINHTFNFLVPSLSSRSRSEYSNWFVSSSYEKMSFKSLCFSFAMLLLIQPMIALIKSQNKNKVKCNAVVFTSTSSLFSIKRLFIRI